MNAWIGTLSPLDRCDGSHAASVAHTYLRACVLDGRIPAGAHINQVDLAERLGLSRTPIREAIRMLQEEGLVDAEPWKKAKVVGFDAAHLEAIYVQRILLEGVATALTVPRMTDEDLESIKQTVQELARLSREPDQADAWAAAHSRFHHALGAAASPHLRRCMESNMERSEHYRSRYRYRGPGPSFHNVGDHEHIVELCCKRDAAGAAAELSVHLARTALSLIGQLAPWYDPAAIRLSLQRPGQLSP